VPTASTGTLTLFSIKMNLSFGFVVHSDSKESLHRIGNMNRTTRINPPCIITNFNQ
ncbi:hypothetical protein Csa_016813, partial [Cucumis sativus]